jgi:tetratricopeptide (TPR) repeat protein
MRPSTEQALAAAAQANARGQYRKALRLLDTALAKNLPLMDTAELLAFRGSVRSEQDDVPQAIADYRLAIHTFVQAGKQNHPNLARTLTLLASVLLDTQQPDEARTCLQQAQAVYEGQPGDITTHPYVVQRGYVMTLYEVGLLAELEKDLPRAEQVYTQALEVAQQVVLDPQDVVLTMVQEGWKRIQEKRYGSNQEYLSDRSIGETLRAFLEMHDMVLYAPGTHAHAGFGWGYGNAPPDERTSGFASLNDMLAACLNELFCGDLPEALALPSPSSDVTVPDLGIMREGIALMTAAMHLDPDAPIPQDLLIACAMETPDDLPNPLRWREVMWSLDFLLDNGFLARDFAGHLYVSSLMHDLLDMVLTMVGRPLVAGRPNAERGLVLLLPDLLDDPDERLDLIVPHLRFVVAEAEAEAQGTLHRALLGVYLAHYCLLDEDWHEAGQTIARLGALLDQGLPKALKRQEALRLADALVDIGEQCAVQGVDDLRRESAWVCCSWALTIRRKGLAPGNEQLATTLETCGLLARDRGDDATALALWREALAVQESRRTAQWAVARCHVFIGDALLGLRRVDEAQEAFGRAEQMCARLDTPAWEGQVVLAHALNGLGTGALMQQQYAEAEGYLKRAMAVLQGQEDEPLVVLQRVRSLTVLIEVLHAQDRPDEGEAKRVLVGLWQVQIEEPATVEEAVLDAVWGAD